MKIKQKKVLITGANRGIGLGLAKAFYDEGAHVLMGMRNTKEFNLKENGFTDEGRAQCVAIDMGSFETIDKFIKENVEHDIDILVNNAGQLTGGLLENQDIKAIYSMFQVNLVGLVHLTQGLLPQMVKRGSGKIVNNASVSGVMHLPCASTYAAAKTGVVAFTNSLSLELKGTGVTTLTLITPGIKTRMFDEIADLYSDNIDLSQLSSISPEEYAQKVLSAIKNDKLFYKPSGSVGVALCLARHIPFLFRKLGTMGFKR
jgi:short-subunit dehydrogenase